MIELATSTLLALTLVSVAGCDEKTADSTHAETRATTTKGDAEAKSAPEAKTTAPAAKAAAIAEADYAKGIMGTWKQVGHSIATSLSGPSDTGASVTRWSVVQPAGFT